ncbi:uncharacterized protein [Argopecten irradians]|uniref:uncharacterized protein n=1 Tax=Argopecten irradians TaxID=31199 RepID=UPI003718CD92
MLTDKVRKGFLFLCFLVVIRIPFLAPYHTGSTREFVTKTEASNTISKIRPNGNHPGKWDPTNEIPKHFFKSLEKIARNLHYASVHARGLKTQVALKKATAEIKNLFGQLDISYRNITERGVTTPRTVCPEEYRGSKFGLNTSYEKGFERIPCNNSKPLSELVTVLILHRNSTESARDTVKDIQKIMPGVQTIIGLDRHLNKKEKSSIERDIPFIKCLGYTARTSEGQIWNDLLKKVRTEYVLIARDINIFDENVRLKRLIGVIEMVGVPIAGGATRDSLDGKWSLGCYQSGMRNYTLVYHEGYDESVQECVMCDCIDGPFVTRTKTLMAKMFDKKINGNGLFLDLFLRVGQENAVVCPDSMFHTRPKKVHASPLTWQSFVDKWKLYKLKFVPGPEILFKCNMKSKQKCTLKKNMLHHPCCLADIIVMLNHLTSTFETRVVDYQLCSGTLLGAVKLNSILPWDVDADIDYLRSNYSALNQFLPQLSFQEHSFQVMNIGKKDTTNFVLKSDISYWYVEIWAESRFTPTAFRTAMENYNGRSVKTMIRVNNVWVHAPFNPGLWARNRYGSEIYKHSQHWRTLGKNTSWGKYPMNDFLKCPEPGHHACLDNYKADGNLQFVDPVP